MGIAGTGAPAEGGGGLGNAPSPVGAGPGAGAGESGALPSAGLTLGANGERVTRNFGPAPSPGFGASPSFGVSFKPAGLGGCGTFGSVMGVRGQMSYMLAKS